MEDYLKIYTIDELSDLKKGLGGIFSHEPKKEGDKLFVSGKGQFKPYQKKSPKGKMFWVHPTPGMSGSGGRNWQVSGSGVKEEKAPKGWKPPKMPEYKTSWSGKSLGDCYTIDELYDLKKGKVYDPAAVAAAVGRKKYGAKKFAEMSATGRSRKKAPKGKAKMRVGGGGRFAKLESEIASKNKGKK